MAGEPTTAIVLRTVPFSETSLIVTLLTEDFGRVSAMAKGARRLRGPFEGALDLLSVAKVVVIRKRSDALDLLTEAKLHRRFRGGSRDLTRLYAGYAVAELLRVLTDDDEPQPEVFRRTLEALREIDGSSDPAIALLFFEVQLMRSLGHQPGFEHCTDCGAVVRDPRGDSDSAVWNFGFDSGGLVCEACRSRQASYARLSESSVRCWTRLSDPAIHLPVEISGEDYGGLRGVVSRFTQTVAGKPLRMARHAPSKLASPLTGPGQSS